MVNGLAQAAEPTASQTQEFTTPSGIHRLKTACRQFEAMFLSRLLGESFKPVSALRGSVPGGALYGSLAVDAFASTLAKGGGLGIAEMLYRQLQGYLAGQAGAPPVESERPDGAAPGVEDMALQRMRAIDPVVTAASRSLGVGGNWVRAIIIQESNVSPRAVSPKGAAGLMQLMSDTAHSMGVQDRFDIAENIRGGVAYFKQLLTQFDGDPELALAGYNAGPGAVVKFGGIPPYPETERYVREVIEKKQLLDEMYPMDRT